MIRAVSVIALLAAGGLCNTAWAQNNPSPPEPTRPAPIVTQDPSSTGTDPGTAGAAPVTAPKAVASPARFAFAVAASDQFEIRSSRLAQRKSADPDIKQFAAMMISDHTQSTNKLIDTLHSTALNPALPTDTDARGKANLRKLQALSGPDFDRAYLHMQIEGHEKALTLLDGYQRTGTEPALKQFAAQISPTVQMHLSKARAIGQKMHVS